MDLEVDFHEEYWTKIVEQVSIYVSYGTHETLKGEITRLCDKLMKVSNSNGNVTVFEDHEGSHIEPLLHIGIRDPIKWSHFPNVEPIIEFLEDWNIQLLWLFFFGLVYLPQHIFPFSFRFVKMLNMKKKKNMVLFGVLFYRKIRWKFVTKEELVGNKNSIYQSVYLYIYIYI